ncbi:hypothetical protein L208DRAFT_1368476 [Tricholoma matsutake]|nr:hypothetical protein L208DRAFT_1368476 [Tricholoma matsutake 945]
MDSRRHSDCGINFYPTRRHSNIIYPSSVSSKVPSEPRIPVFESTVQSDVEQTSFGERTPLLRVATQRVKSNVGLLLIIASQFFLAVINLLVKQLQAIDPRIGTIEIIVLKMALSLPCCLIYMYWRGIPDPLLGPKGVRMLLALRGVSGFVGVLGLYFSLNYLSLSDASVLTFLVPLGTGFSASRFLGERFTKMEVFAIFSLLGVVLIAHPPFLFGDSETASGPLLLIDGGEKGTAAERLLAVGGALLGVAGTVGTYTSLRAIGHRAHPLHAMVSYCTQSVIVGSIMMLIMAEPVVIPTNWEWSALLFGTAIGGICAQTLLTVGFVYETAGRGALGIYSQMMFAMMLQWIFFHSLPSTLSFIGSFIIITSTLFVVSKKEQAKSDEKIVGSDNLEAGPASC